MVVVINGVAKISSHEGHTCTFISSCKGFSKRVLRLEREQEGIFDTFDKVEVGEDRRGSEEFKTIKGLDGFRVLRETDWARLGFPSF